MGWVTPRPSSSRRGSNNPATVRTGRGEAGAARRERGLTTSEPEARPPCARPVIGPLVVGGGVLDERIDWADAHPSADHGNVVQRRSRPAGAWALVRLVGGPSMARQ